jgi:hypothetical protein
MQNENLRNYINNDPQFSNINYDLYFEVMEEFLKDFETYKKDNEEACNSNEYKEHIAYIDYATSRPYMPAPFILYSIPSKVTHEGITAEESIVINFTATVVGMVERICLSSKSLLIDAASNKDIFKNVLTLDLITSYWEMLQPWLDYWKNCCDDERTPILKTYMGKLKKIEAATAFYISSMLIRQTIYV